MRDHETMGPNYPSCLPGGCGPDNDIDALLEELSRFQKVGERLYIRVEDAT